MSTVYIIRRGFVAGRGLYWTGMSWSSDRRHAYRCDARTLAEAVAASFDLARVVRLKPAVSP